MPLEIYKFKQEEKVTKDDFIVEEEKLCLEEMKRQE